MLAITANCVEAKRLFSLSLLRVLFLPFSLFGQRCSLAQEKKETKQKIREIEIKREGNKRKRKQTKEETFTRNCYCENLAVNCSPACRRCCFPESCCWRFRVATWRKTARIPSSEETPVDGGDLTVNDAFIHTANLGPRSSFGWRANFTVPWSPQDKL